MEAITKDEHFKAVREQRRITFWDKREKGSNFNSLIIPWEEVEAVRKPWDALKILSFRIVG